MTTPSMAVRTRLSGALTLVLILLALSVFINYIDRGNLSIAAPLLKSELRISDSQLGLLLSSFFWTYAMFQIVSGWLVDRFNVNWVIAGGFFLWSAATAATGLIQGFAALMVLRLILGIGESVAYPSYSKILARHFPEYHRGLANALIDAGSKCGPAIGTLLGGVLMAKYGWRPFFIVLGLVSLLWLVPWIRWMPRGDIRVKQGEMKAPGIGQILRQRSAWGSFGGLFCTNYFWYFLLTWMPSYLVRERHFAMEKMAVVGACAYFAIGVATTISGWLSDRWIAAGADTTRVRKGFAGVGLTLSIVIIGVSIVSDQTIAMTLLMLSCAAFGIYTCSLWSITQTIAGPMAAGKWTGLQNFMGNLAGVVAPWLTGVVLEKTGEFFWAFVLAAGMELIAVVMFLFVIGKVEPVRWTET
jgi:ACS family D-galactonate transporter-like MFS transporter